MMVSGCSSKSSSAAGPQTASSSSSGASSIPASATIEKRDFVHTLRVHGTVEAVTSYTVAAPRLSGPGLNTMVITRLVPAGSKVKKNDLLVEFDRQAQERNFIDRQAEFRDLEEQIKRKKAEQAIALFRDKTELRQAENAVKTAELELRRNEVISRIDGEKNQQNHEESVARLEAFRDTFELKRKAEQADLRIIEIRRDRARNAMEYSKQNSERMVIRAPFDGIVVLNNIWKGNSMSEVVEGDEVRPGVPFLQVVNPNAMQVRARVNQTDVTYLQLGQIVAIRLDAYPELNFKGKVERIAAIGTASGLSNKVRTFNAVFSIEGTDVKLMPDLSAAVDIRLQSLPGVLVAPRDAVVSEDGKEYVLDDSGKKIPVKIGPANDQEVVIESGANAGTKVRRANGSGAGRT